MNHGAQKVKFLPYNDPKDCISSSVKTCCMNSNSYD